MIVYSTFETVQDPAQWKHLTVNGTICQERKISIMNFFYRKFSHVFQPFFSCSAQQFAQQNPEMVDNLRAQYQQGSHPSSENQDGAGQPPSNNEHQHRDGYS